MITRYFQLNNELEGSVFLFGARQTGKSTFLEAQFPNATYIDLLDAKSRRRFRAKPELLYEMLQDKQEGSIVVIDEIPEVPELLSEVHRLIQKKNLRFVLSGSSARKLKRKGHDTLGGRAVPCYFYPFVSAEIANLDLDKALLYGMLPPHYLAKQPQRLLDGYIDVYLREEIKEEALVRNLDAFQRFMEVAATCDGEIVNYENISNDCQVSAKTVKEYFGILSDTLIGYTIPAYTKVVKRKVVQAPKFYYFDVGVANYLMGRHSLKRGTDDYGHAFEHLVVQELVAYRGYRGKRETLSYWHTYDQKEVDVVIGDAEVAIEIKSTEHVETKHKKGLNAFAEEHPDCRLILVSLDPITRKSAEVEQMYVIDFLRLLWGGEIF